MTTPHATMSFDDVLDELLLEHGAPTPQAVAAAAVRHPAHKAALLEFAASWAEDDHLPIPKIDEQREQSLLGDAMSKFSASAAPIAAATLLDLAGAARLTLTDIAQDLGVDPVIVSKLNARRIDPRTIGRATASRVGRFLRVDTARVVSAWSGEPPRLAAAAFLPQATGLSQETFLTALEKAGVSPELIAELLSD